MYLLTVTVALTWAGSYHFVLGSNGSSTYNFGYDTKQEHEGVEAGPRLMREETRLSDGTVVGRYGYTDPFGVFRQVEYVAGPNGYYAYEDVGGRRGAGSLPLLFKATARQRDAGRMAGLAVLSDKFNPPLYHPEAHLADDTSVVSVESSATLDGDLARLNKIPSPIASTQRRFNVERSVPTSSVYSLASSLPPAPAITESREESVSKLERNSPEYRNDEPVASENQGLGPSSSPKTAFQFDYDQQALKKDEHNSNDHLLRRNDDLKELESYSLPSNFNLYKIDSIKPYSPETSTSSLRRSSSSDKSLHFQLSDLPLSALTSTSSGLKQDHVVEEMPSQAPRDENSKHEVEIISVNNLSRNHSSSTAVSAPSTDNSSLSENSSHSEFGYDLASDLNAEQPISGHEGDIIDGDSDIKILGSSLSASTSVVINDTFEGLRERDASIPEVEILSTYGKRLAPRVDEYDAESFIHYGPRIVPTFFSDSK